MRSIRMIRRSLASAALVTILSNAELLAMTSAPSPTERATLIGRFSVILPIEARALTDAKYQGINVTDNGAVASFAELKQRIQTQSESYAASKVPSNPGDDSLMRAAGMEPAKEHTGSRLIGFDVYADRNEVTISYLPEIASVAANIDLHKLINEHDIVLSRKDIGISTYSFQRNDLMKAAERLHPLNSHVADAPAGFSVGDGVFTDDGSQASASNATLVAYDAKHPELTLIFTVSDIEQRSSGPSLSARADDELAQLRKLNHDLTVIYRGARLAAGQPGYLIAIIGTDPDNPKLVMYKYFWEAPGVPNDVKYPAMTVELHTDARNDARSSFKSTQEVTEYFDHFLKSIHYRTSIH